MRLVATRRDVLVRAIDRKCAEADVTDLLKEYNGSPHGDSR